MNQSAKRFAVLGALAIVGVAVPKAKASFLGDVFNKVEGIAKSAASDVISKGSGFLHGAIDAARSSAENMVTTLDRGAKSLVATGQASAAQFLAKQAEYLRAHLPSCLGSSVTKLAQLGQGGIRHLGDLLNA